MENGWAQVTYNDQTGYVSTDFVETVVDDTASDNVTADEAADDTASDSINADDTADSTAN